MLLVKEIRLPLSGGTQQAIHIACKRLQLKREAVQSASIAKLSVDARHGKTTLIYTVALQLEAETSYEGFPNVTVVPAAQPLIITNGTAPLEHRPVVCGLGPAGLFAALVLARQGFRPVVLERGPEMEKRLAAVTQFQKTGILQPNANIQFGEGGAGTFSDGKLTTRIKDPLCAFVLDTFLKHGAPPEIAQQQKPHIGTDKLRGVIASIRQEIVRLGGEVFFETQLTGVQQTNGRITAVTTNQGQLPCSALILAVGHSARDTFFMLQQAGFGLTAKPFSVGFRAEHLQSKIEESLYHAAAGHPALPKGEYQLSHHVGKRCVYTFCMCPGGSVVPAASEEDCVVTNGMSNHARDGKNANAAVVVSVNETDFDGDALKAIAFQRRLEHAAFTAGGGGYQAPAQTIQSFLQGSADLNLGEVQPSYSRGVTPYNLGTLLPAELTGALQTGLQAFERKLRGYTAPDAILTGLETRTSSPVRLLRGADFKSVDLQGVYPCGEGAGYAGGIMSAAVDGVRVAKMIAETYRP